ncbi:MAG TPA: hypothetical protein VJ729_01835 [Nitrososphaeraceae archaeon]|nr:hypothetical protein [Nitrososphaeraceae archaeon]
MCIVLLAFLSIAAVINCYFIPYANADTPDNEFLSGYREGVLQAHQDIAEHKNVEANEAQIPCASNWSSDFCSGYKAGYSHETLDEIP